MRKIKLLFWLFNVCFFNQLYSQSSFCCETLECQRSNVVINYSALELAGHLNGQGQKWLLGVKDFSTMKRLSKQEMQSNLIPHGASTINQPINETFAAYCIHLEALEGNSETDFEVVGKGLLVINNITENNVVKLKKIKSLEQNDRYAIIEVQYVWYGKSIGTPLFYLKEKITMIVEGFQTTEREYYIDKKFDKNSNRITVTPNPVNVTVKVSVDTDLLDPNAQYDIDITSYQGAVLKTKSLNNKKFIDFDVSSFVPGSYLAKLRKGQNIEEVVQFIKN